MSAGAPSASDAIGLSRANLVRAIRLPRSGTASGVIPEHWPRRATPHQTCRLAVGVCRRLDASPELFAVRPSVWRQERVRNDHVRKGRDLAAGDPVDRDDVERRIAGGRDPEAAEDSVRDLCLEQVARHRRARPVGPGDRAQQDVDRLSCLDRVTSRRNGSSHSRATWSCRPTAASRSTTSSRASTRWSPHAQGHGEYRSRLSARRWTRPRGRRMACLPWPT